MDKFLGLTVGGFATGAIYAIAASGLVLTYSTTGTFNFAHGAIGMIAAFLYWQLHYAWGWSTLLSLAAVLLVAGPLFGAGIERVIMRRLEGTSETTRLVVTISLLLGLLGLSVTIWDPQVSRPVRQFFQGNVIELAGVRIPWHQIVALIVATLVAVGLRTLLYRTRQGVAMRAGVDNRSLAALTGARPERSAMLAWAIGCSLAALSGILIAPTLTMSAVPLTLLIVNAYGAAVFGRLRSLPLTFLGAVIIGLATSYGLGYLSDFPSDVQPFVRGLVDALPAIILFVVVLILPASRLGRVGRTREIAAKPTWGGSFAMAISVVVVSAMIVPLLNDSDLVAIAKIWGLALIGLSMVPLVGWAGQLSLAQLSFAAIGAVAYAHLGWANPIGLLWAAAAAALAAVLVALPVVRLQGIYVALATAAFAVLCDRWVFPLPEFSLGTQGFQVFSGGTLDVVRPDFLGLDLTSPTAYFIYAAVIFSLTLCGVVAIRRSPYGAQLIAIKEGPAAVATVGINVTGAKLGVFAISGAIAGVGGAILSGAEPATSSTFDFVAGLPLLLSMVLSGISAVGAAVITGVFLGSPLVTKALSSIVDFSKWQNVFIGLAGIGLGNNPNGGTADLRPISAGVKADRPVLAAMVGLLLAVWGLRIGDVYGNGQYLALTLSVLIGASVVAGRRAKRRHGDARVDPAVTDEAGAGLVHALMSRAGPETDEARGLAVHPEAMGLTRPFTVEDVAALDEAIDLPAGMARARAEVTGARGR